MIKLTSIVREELDRKRKSYLKAAKDMATSYAKRGYTPEEAIADAAKGIENVYGYVLTPEEREALKHWIPVHGSFK
jgi:hypothetical protein